MKHIAYLRLYIIIQGLTNSFAKSQQEGFSTTASYNARKKLGAWWYLWICELQSMAALAKLSSIINAYDEQRYDQCPKHTCSHQECASATPPRQSTLHKITGEIQLHQRHSQ